MSKLSWSFRGEPWWTGPHAWLADRETSEANTAAAARMGSGDLAISLSGGADSTATYLHLLESGFLEAWEKAGGRVFRTFMDTGWELPETYAYLNTLEAKIGKIHRLVTWVPGPGEVPPVGFDHLEPIWKTAKGGNNGVMDGDRYALAKMFEARLGHYSPMVRLILQWGKVPTSVRRWCTADLKAKPVTGFLATLDNPVNVIGIRAEESQPRARAPAWAWSDDYDCWVWRPIKWWTKADRIAVHQRHGLAPNPLYLQGDGAGRVGCSVCVHSGKNDLRWLAAHHPAALAVLSDLEAVLGDLDTAAKRAGAEAPFWFTLSIDGGVVGVPLKSAVEWAQTERGGRQVPLFRPATDPGCSAWGLCEVPNDRG